MERVPAVGIETPGALLGKGHVRPGGGRHVLVVVETDELAELEMSRERRRFGTAAFHEIAVADDPPGAVIDRRGAIAVVARGEMRLADGHADRIRDALPERPRRDFDALCMTALGMTRCLAAPLPELLDV